MFKGVLKSSMLDYPEHVCSVLFTGGCNWECEYCHNKSLYNNDFLNTEEVFSALVKRKGTVDHVVISGGEPTIHGDKLINFVRKMHSEGFIIGLHTNGSNYGVIEALIPYLSFVGFDVKGGYRTYMEHILRGIFKKNKYSDILKSLDAVSKSSVELEVRTTFYPKYLDDVGDFIDVARMLRSKGVKNYVVQRCSIHHMSPQAYEDSILQIKESIEHLVSITIR